MNTRQKAKGDTYYQLPTIPQRLTSYPSYTDIILTLLCILLST